MSDAKFASEWSWDLIGIVDELQYMQGATKPTDAALHDGFLTFMNSYYDIPYLVEAHPQITENAWECRMWGIEDHRGGDAELALRVHHAASTQPDLIYTMGSPESVFNYYGLAYREVPLTSYTARCLAYCAESSSDIMFTKGNE